MNFYNQVSAVLVLLLVIYVFIDAIASSRQDSPVEPLGRQRKSLAFLALGLGLATFFGTLVVVNPAVMSRSQWSAVDMVSGIWDGTFPPPKGGGFGIVLIDLALAYLLILVALITFCFSRSQKLLKVVGLIGCLLSIEALGRGDRSFKVTFFGVATAQGNTINYGAAMYMLPLAMAALVLISVLDSLDL
jgi:hypothetical protein